MTTQPAGTPVDIDKAIADVRRARRGTDPITLHAVAMGEDYARQLAIDFPDRADWPVVVRAILVSTSMNASLIATSTATLFLGVTASNYARTMLNVAALGAIELLDRLELETAEGLR